MPQKDEMMLELWLTIGMVAILLKKVAHYWNGGYTIGMEWWLYYWNGGYTIEKVAHYWNGGYTIGMVAILLK